jgi:hypothetical protein
LLLVCRYGVNIPVQWFAQGDMPKYMTCANDGQDKLKCCRDYNVNNRTLAIFDCSNICKPEFASNHRRCDYN